MASGKLSGKSRPSEILLNRIARSVDPRHLGSLAIDVEVSDVELSKIKVDFMSDTQRQAFLVLKAWDNRSGGPDTQALIDRLWAWKRSGYVDVDVMENIQQLVDIDLKTSQSNKILKDIHLDKIAQTVAQDSELAELGTASLCVREGLVRQALHDHPRDIRAASLEVLRHWLRQQVNREEAYTVLHTSLRRANWNYIAAQLKHWVEGENA